MKTITRRNPTAFELRALAVISSGKARSAAALAGILYENDPRNTQGTRFGKSAQGLGRVGGTVAARLEKMGYARERFDREGYSLGWVITRDGESALLRAVEARP